MIDLNLDCTQLSGRRRHICQGYDDHGNPVDISPEKRKEYLVRWSGQANGIALDDGTRASRRRCGGCGTGDAAIAKLNDHGPGSQLLKIYEQAGVPHCPACYELAVRMDVWGAAECRKRVDEIVSEILPRAKAWLSDHKPWVHKLLAGVGLDDMAIRQRLRRDVSKAIEAAESAAPLLAHRSKRDRSRHWTSAFRLGKGTPEFVTNEQFSRDVKSLISQLPPNISQVAGVSRSGLYPATMISMLLHVPLVVVRHHQNDWFPAGNGWRLNQDRQKTQGITLCIDDTVMTGNSLRRTKAVTADLPGEKLFAAVYVNPAATMKPDLWAVDLPWPHLLEWNLFNSVLSPMMSTDFDGILCCDCPPADNDDGSRYLRFLESAVPLYLTRKTPVPLIVTARLEKYRPQTLAWLAKWGIRVERLVMGPWENNSQRARHDIAAFKAEHYRSFRSTHRRGPLPHLFIESNPDLAERIARLSGGIVVCPAAERCFP